MKHLVAIVLGLLLVAPALSQKQPKHSKPSVAPKFVVDDSVLAAIPRLQKAGLWRYPITDMWDEAFARSKKSGKPVIVFNVDFVDSASIGFHDRVLRDPNVLAYLFEHFEVAINDYSVDPPPSVGLDSLRNLGHKLDAIEKGYAIAVRPTALILQQDSTEVERIPYPNLMTGQEFIQKIQGYEAGIGTIKSLRQQFWRDTSNFDARHAYLQRLSQRSEYDSVIYQLGVIAQMFGHVAEARDAARQYAYLRMSVEGQPQYVRSWIAALPKRGEDSLLALQGLRDLLEFYQTRKKMDSIAVFYDRIFEYTGVRDPEMLNNYAWDLASHSKRWAEALTLSDEAIAAKPKTADFYDTRALIHWSMQDFEGAARDAQAALKYAKGKDDKSYFKERLKFYNDQLKKSKDKPAEETTPLQPLGN